MKTSMLSAERRKSGRVFGVKRMFRDNFSISNVGGSSFVAIDHSGSELGGVLRLFIFAFICVLQIIEIEGKIQFEFEDRVIPQSRVRKVSVPSSFCGIIQHFVDQVNVWGNTIVDTQGISMILSSSYRQAYIPRDNVTRIYYNILAKSDISKLSK